MDDRAEFPEESLRALVAAGLHAVGIPETYGGQGGDHLASAVVAEQIARVCATTQQVAGGNELFALPLLLAGSDDLKRRYLPAVASGEMLGAFALTEPDAGSDVAALRMRARPVTGGWLLTGTKRSITNAGRADAYVVFASTDPDAGSRGISAFVVEAADEGIAQGALDVAVAFAAQRHQFGSAISDFQGVSFLAADMATRVEASRLLTWSAARAVDDGRAGIGAAGAMAKCFASDTAMAVTTDAVQILGGSGYVRDFPVERMMRDAKITQIYEGTNQIQRIVIARHLFG